MHSIQRHIVAINQVHVHYQRLGEGPLLLLLHPSPRTGKMLLPLMQVLGETCTCVAPDTPGYGASDALPHEPQSLADYLPYFAGLVESLAGKGQKVAVYGSATGAQLAIALGIHYPQLVQHVFLDNVAHFTDEERTHLLQGYFPDLTPMADGSHLTRLWQHAVAASQFFPWNETVEKNRIAAAAAPPAVLQQMVLDYQLAGEQYDWAYRLAFEQEHIDNLRQLILPTTIFKWLASPILKPLQALLAHDLPANMAVVETPNLLAERYKVMKVHIAQQLL
jgi:pimeloyl-ACP methyl ester carboxylesterase